MGHKETNQFLNVLGTPGRYAWIVFGLVCLNYLPVAFNHLAMAIYGARPPHSCHLPEYVAKNNNSIPSSANGKLDSCSVYTNYTYTTGTTEKCAEWDFTLLGKESTIVNEWNLVCDDKYLPNLATTIYFAGVMVGGLVCGHLADVTGRRTMMLVTLYTPVLLGVMVYLVQSITLFMLLRFTIGVMIQGLQISVYVLAVELQTTSKYRALTAAVFEVYWSCGVMLLAAIAYIFKAWRHIQLAIALLPLLSLLFMWFTPESLRWLINKQRYKESLAYMKRVARINKVTISPDIEQKLRDVCDKTKTVIKPRGKRYTLWDAFKTPNLRKNTFIMFYVWLATSLVYYGLSLQASRFTGDKYLNFFISGAIEFPAYLSGIWILGYIGRRIPLCTYFMIGGVSCILAGTIPKVTDSGSDIAWVSTMLAWIGKFSTAGCWSVLFLYASEIYPTLIRNAGVGACAFWARVGSLVAPQINLIAEYSHSWIPFVIFGAVSILGGFLTLLLPETKDAVFPDTFEEAENIGKSQRKNPLDDDVPAGHDVIQTKSSMAGYTNVAADVSDDTHL